MLEEIPFSLCTPDHVARWRNGGDSSTYKLVRRPVDLDELSKYAPKLAIWRDNKTLVYVSPHHVYDFPREDTRKYLCLHYQSGPEFYILGRTDNAIVETAAFLLSLEEPTEESSSLFDNALSTSSFV